MPLVLTLDKSLSLLEAVVAHRDGIGTRALAQELDLNVATVHNIARTFCHRGYLRQDSGTKTFFPGMRLMLLGRQPSYLQSLAVSASPIIEKVAKKLNESVMLASIDHGHILNLKYVPSRQALRVHEADDISDHSYCTAVGKVLLASLSKPELEAYLRKTPLQHFTPHTLSTPEALKEELRKIAIQGYGETRDEAAEGVSAIAVPVRDPWNVIVAGIGASAPTVRLQDADHFETTLRELREAAALVEKQWTENRQPEGKGKGKTAPKAKAPSKTPAPQQAAA
ncbi:transcriptional regulator, IclR family [Verrucomicrobium sp. GAS474]|uniref:IclR family transcriptional regulator n=1 Tax=Verrucomicrobium sp. GAS474 TaxID=1882831 RepID=UPI00087D7B73|nr:IclR family transcriptional regulator [Verrucomicrobium sp. GAS474]SDT99002.1 transcriptional regulator, IclR family [Verrucomicrobium sp. GAS474]